MIRRISEGLVSDWVVVRILWLSVLFVIVFFGATIFSFYTILR